MASLMIWCVFGGMAGWLFGLVRYDDIQRNAVRHILAGAAGGVVAGAVFSWNAAPAVLGLGSVGAAVVGAIAASVAADRFRAGPAH